MVVQDHRQADRPFISSVVQLSQNLMVKLGAAQRGQAFIASGSVLYCVCRVAMAQAMRASLLANAQATT
ncbi:hypothetical protein, partial [Pseudomonas sp. DrBHI1]|uniref:hypothetical protein n=1 Tax=Pseudomonas sp. DrBHI1 TaxID=2006091 RepID=UPI0021155D14